MVVENNPGSGDGVLDPEEVDKVEDRSHQVVADVDKMWDNALFLL